jgi:hypothetical protein
MNSDIHDLWPMRFPQAHLAGLLQIATVLTSHVAFVERPAFHNVGQRTHFTSKGIPLPLAVQGGSIRS